MWQAANRLAAAEQAAAEVDCETCRARRGDRCLAPTGLVASAPCPRRLEQAASVKARGALVA